MSIFFCLFVWNIQSISKQFVVCSMSNKISDVNATNDFCCCCVLHVLSSKWLDIRIYYLSWFFFFVVYCVRMRQRFGVGDCVIYVVHRDTFILFFFSFNLTTIERETQQKYIAYAMSAERILTALYSTSHEQKKKKVIVVEKRTIRRCCVQFIQYTQTAQNLHAHIHIRCDTYDEARTHIHTMFVDFIFPVAVVDVDVVVVVVAVAVVVVASSSTMMTSLFVAPQHHTNQYRTSIEHAKMFRICVMCVCVCRCICRFRTYLTDDKIVR